MNAVFIAKRGELVLCHGLTFQCQTGAVVANHSVGAPNGVEGAEAKTLSPKHIVKAKDFQVVTDCENVGVHGLTFQRMPNIGVSSITAEAACKSCGNLLNASFAACSVLNWVLLSKAVLRSA